jgi:endogenous inhibitor of DNA gyrase (YacG/DUF329 family)
MALSPAQRAHLDQVRPLATAWHATEEGQAWHSAHSTQNWANATYVTTNCANCGTEFEAPTMAGARFCSTNCSRQHRDAEHRYDVEVPCPVCGELFWQNKYRGRPATCSRVCGWAQRKATEPEQADLAQAAQPSSAAARRGQRLAARRAAK